MKAEEEILGMLKDLAAVGRDTLEELKKLEARVSHLEATGVMR